MLLTDEEQEQVKRLDGIIDSLDRVRSVASKARTVITHKAHNRRRRKYGNIIETKLIPYAGKE
jgi:hypothetical protein